MEDRQWFDVMLLPFAVVAGGAMFLGGKRFIETGSRGRLLNRFVFLTSVVIVVLGGFFDGTPSRAQTRVDTLSSVAEKTAGSLAASPAWAKVRDLWARLVGSSDATSPCSDSEFQSLTADVQAVESAPDLGLGNAVPPAFIEYVRVQIDHELARVKRADGSGGLAREAEAQRFGATLRQHAQLVKSLSERWAGDCETTQFVEAGLARTFTRVAGVPLAVRLEQTAMSRDEYKNLVAEAIDGTFVVCRRQASSDRTNVAPISTPQQPVNNLEYGVRPGDMAEPPMSRSKYGVREMPEPPMARSKYGVREIPTPIAPPQATPAYGVREMPDPGPPNVLARSPGASTPGHSGDVGTLRGMVMMKQAGGAWVQLMTGNTVYLSTMLENTQGSAALIDFSTTTSATVEAHDLVTGWELKARTGLDLPRGL